MCRSLLKYTGGEMTSLHDKLRSRAPDVSDIAFPYCGAIGVLHDLVACEVLYFINSVPSARRLHA